MKESPLKNRLLPVAQRHRWMRLARRLAWGWLVALVGSLGVGLLLGALGLGSPWTVPTLAALTALLTAVLAGREWRKPLVWREAAESVEKAFPDLQGLVLTAAQQEPDIYGELPALQQRLVDRAAKHGSQHDWRSAVSFSRLSLASAPAAGALALLGLVWWMNHQPAARRLETVARRVLIRSGVEVTPGDVQLEKGESLVVLARFGGVAPAGADLVFRTAQGREQRVALARNLKDPVFGGTVPEVGEDMSYHVEYAGKSTAAYRVTVYEHPKLVRADADLTFPAYTRLPARRIEDTRRITAVEGARVDLTLNLNKAVASAQLVPRSTNQAALSLQFTTNRAVLQLSQHLLETSGTYDLRLVDADGRTNKVASSLVFEAQRNRIPEMKLAAPKGDVRPSALEEIRFEGTVWDDFGIEAYGLAYTVSDGEVRTVQLGGSVAAQTRVPFQHELRLEEMGVRADQLLAWFVWADDLGPDGLVRRNQGDMFYAEIRPFETVYREGEGGGGGESGGGEEGGGVKKLAEMQKQIINATWKLQREHGGRSKPDGRGAPAAPTDSAPAAKPTRGSGARWPVVAPVDPLLSAEFREKWLRGSRTYLGQVPSEPGQPGETRRPRPARLGDAPQRPAGGASRSPRAIAPVSFDADIQVVRESMEKALEQAKEAQESQDDPRSAALWATVVKDMEAAVKQLQSTRTAADLPQALTAQRAAYEGLLKLRERESRVQRGQRQSGSGQSEGEQMTDRQMEQLDLEQSENKYETQRQAQAAANPEQRETQQVLNRLAELARRQQDMNAQLKELQAALQEARTESEREAAQRRLKRLQEEQQQMLADADELQQRMNREENQSRMSEQRRQLEQTREELQQAAEATGDGQVSKALTSGTRAQRQLQEMREDLRRQNSSALAEDLKDLRAESRKLVQKQAEISKQFQEPASTGRKSLASQDNTEALAKQLSEQRSRMTNLLARATEVSSQAEASEPLVSRQLYDSLRKFATDDTTNVKRLREQLARDGILSDSGNARLKELAEGDGAKTLQAAEEFMQRGGREIARSINQVAEKDIEALSRGLERAAEGVLGDDTETLRMAQQELDALTGQLEREMSQLRGTNGPAGAAAGSERSNTSQAQRRPGGAGRGTNAPNSAATGPGGQPDPSGTGEAAEGAGEGDQAQAPGSNPEGRGRGNRPGERGEQPGAPGSSGSRAGQQAATQPGREPSETPGSPGTGRQPGEQGNEPAPAQASAEPGQAQGEGQGQGQGQGQGPGQGRGQGGTANAPQNPGQGARQAQRRLSGNRAPGSNRGDDLSSFFSGGTESRGSGGPITGGNYAEWSDRLRDVEEMVDQTELRTEVAAARDQARLMRIEYNRAGKKPDWATLDRQVIRPLVEVRARIQEELARRGSRENLVPIDRDPVPNKYAERVRRYYEQLGQQK